LADVVYPMAHIPGALNVIANFLFGPEKTEKAKLKIALLGELSGRNIVNEKRKMTGKEDLFLSYKKLHNRDEYVYSGFKQLHKIIRSKSSKNVNRKILKEVLHSCKVRQPCGRPNGTILAPVKLRKLERWENIYQLI
jgi:hypothetical protein